MTANTLRRQDGNEISNGDAYRQIRNFAVVQILDRVHFCFGILRQVFNRGICGVGGRRGGR